ncbi:hypothetical protein [Corynebacterium sp. H78]|uniref:hypothetical protein n=1 Tax=Corynebacterium sp. H78 TaxID=3133417 RepID=UPI0030A315FB
MIDRIIFFTIIGGYMAYRGAPTWLWVMLSTALIYELGIATWKELTGFPREQDS